MSARTKVAAPTLPPNLSVNLAGLVPRPQEWLWNGMIPRGTLTIVGGRGGSGKSTLLSHLAASVSRGTLPGSFREEPANVLYLTKEDSIEATLVPRLLNAGADLQRINADDQDHRFPADADELLRKLERDHVKLLILDPLMAYFQKLTTYGKSMEQLNTFIDGCARRDVTVVAITHVTKSSKKPEANAFFGSAGLGTTVRQALMVGETDESRVVGVVKSNVGASGHGWVFTMTETPLDLWPDISAPAVSLIRPAHRREVESMFEATESSEDRVLYLLDLVAQKPALDTREAQELLCREFGIKDRSARNVIGEAAGRYLLTRSCVGKGASRKWTLDLSDDGRLMLEEAVLV